MTNEDSNMAANAICHAANMASAAIQQAVSCQMEPSVLYRPRIFQDGNQWCALLGEDLQVGICGWGFSPAEAVAAFNTAWITPTTAKVQGETKYD
jgi:hypothetical protein